MIDYEMFNSHEVELWGAYVLIFLMFGRNILEIVVRPHCFLFFGEKMMSTICRFQQQEPETWNPGQSIGKALIIGRLGRLTCDVIGSECLPKIDSHGGPEKRISQNNYDIF